MNYHKEDESDRAVKQYAKNKAINAAKKKLAEKTGKQAGKVAGVAAKKTAILIGSAIATPMGLTILIVIILMFCLPSLITSTTYGTDSKYDASSLNGTATGASWEDDAEAAINERYQSLKSAAFWQDMSTLLSSGKWGQEGTLFETEYANAKDSEDSLTDGYFSSSNRLVAIVNEAFRLSLQNGRAKSNALKFANETKDDLDAEIRSSSTYGKPANVKDSDYTVSITIEADPNLGNQNFIYESCYVLAAASANSAVTDNYQSGVRSMLDEAFSITGLDTPANKDICWETTATTEIDPPVKSSYIDHYEITDEDGEVTTYYQYSNIPVDLRSKAVAIRNETVKITARVIYSINLVSNFKDIVNERCNVETELSEDAEDYEIPMSEQVNTSAIELAKLYGASGGAWGSIGEAGLPLPRGSYSITSTFGTRTLKINGKTEVNNHGGVDLAAAYGTPIYAVKDGTCTVPTYMANGYGNYVVIDHGDGIETRYGHMSSVVVTNGQTVTAGEIIGFVGSTGKSTGNHLHFEIIINGTKIDPLKSDLGAEIEAAASA